jgi:2-succinyl-5-enolpyruvyl-6-hydroxy-3-cyclohexene-1-carboxylate synthase
VGRGQCENGFDNGNPRTEVNSNQQLSNFIVSQLIEKGARCFVVCAGARNAPLVQAVLSHENSELEIFHHPEERSASFFALGLAMSNEKPAVVLTTSGTAVSECLSAIIEAHYSQIPLWIVSADRPKSFRGSGAPQAIEQVGIFSRYAETQDFENIKPLQVSFGPCHFNICLAEPASQEYP